MNLQPIDSGRYFKFGFTCSNCKKAGNSENGFANLDVINDYLCVQCVSTYQLMASAAIHEYIKDAGFMSDTTKITDAIIASERRQARANGGVWQ